MGVIGKGTSSFKKKDVMEQKSIALGFKKIRFAHKAVAGETGINLTALVLPTEMSSKGFTNPSPSALAAGNIFIFRNNLKLMSSLRGLLIDQLSYVVAGSSQINFIDFAAEDGEIFTGWLDEAPTTSLNAVDGGSIVATGPLEIGQTDFNVGTPFTINENSSQQMGAVLVYRNGLLQARCEGNTLSGEGNYIEVPVGGGLGSLIRFKIAPVSSADAIMVTSNGVVAERPDGSMMAAIERVQGQVDAMVPTLAAVAGVPESDFQTAPNDIDLKQFGDTAVGMGNLTVPNIWSQTVSLVGSGNFNAGSLNIRRIGDVVTISWSSFNHPASGAPNSATGLLPIWATPADSCHNTYRIEPNVVKQALVHNTGVFGIEYRDWAGATVASVTVASGGSLTFVMQDGLGYDTIKNLI